MIDSTRHASDCHANAGSRQLHPERYELTTSVPPRWRAAGGSAEAQTVSSVAASAAGLLPISIVSTTSALSRSMRNTLPAEGLAAQITPPDEAMLETSGATDASRITEPEVASIFETVPSSALATHTASPSIPIARGPLPTGIVWITARFLTS